MTSEETERFRLPLDLLLGGGGGNDNFKKYNIIWICTLQEHSKRLSTDGHAKNIPTRTHVFPIDLAIGLSTGR